MSAIGRWDAACVDVEYVDSEYAGKAFFDCSADPWQTRNIYPELPDGTKAELTELLALLADCKGDECP